MCLALVSTALPAQQKSANTGARVDTSTGDMGQYNLYGLPPGDYQLSISLAGAGNFVQKVVTVKPAEPLRWDIILPLV